MVSVQDPIVKPHKLLRDGSLQSQHACHDATTWGVGVILRPMEPFYREFGNALRRAREAKAVSQTTLAAEVGLSRTSIANIERGRQRVLLHLLPEFGRVLGVDPTRLLPQTDPADLDQAERQLRDLSPADQQTFRRVLRRAQQERGDDDA
jgi:transcriptional regulator with XRE-family HTH domain